MESLSRGLNHDADLDMGAFCQAIAAARQRPRPSAVDSAQYNAGWDFALELALCFTAAATDAGKGELFPDADDAPDVACH